VGCAEPSTRGWGLQVCGARPWRSCSYQCVRGFTVHAAARGGSLHLRVCRGARLQKSRSRLCCAVREGASAGGGWWFSRSHGIKPPCMPQAPRSRIAGFAGRSTLGNGSWRVELQWPISMSLLQGCCLQGTMRECGASSLPCTARHRNCAVAHDCWCATDSVAVSSRGAPCVATGTLETAMQEVDP
jgi:hypothetical protein